MININNRDKINIRDKKLTVLGLGLSGTASAILANHIGAKVFGSDSSAENNILSNSWELMHKYHIATETGLHSDQIYDSDLWVISPGIAKNSALIQKAKKQNIPIVSEIEFASWFTKSPIVAITGSNGKTTTSHILAEMSSSKKINGIMAGNMGIPFSNCILNELLNPDKKRIYILEVSSFQMEFIKHFSPHIALYTNISEDHLDRHGSFKEYFNMKLKMIQNIKTNGSIVYNAADSKLHSTFKKYNQDGKIYCFNAPGSLFNVNGDSIRNTEETINFSVKNLSLPGKHNISNFLSAASCASLIGVEKNKIVKVFKTFKGVEHRLENVLSFNNVQYINDSKATNIDSVIVAIKTFTKPKILILGGYNKNADFRLLLPHIKSSHVRLIISYGEAGGQINTVLGDAVRSLLFNDLSSAVNQAQKLAKPGEIILFSPGCASFDQFKNFEDRGKYFKSLVKKYHND